MHIEHRWQYLFIISDTRDESRESNLLNNNCFKYQKITKIKMYTNIEGILIYR